MISVYFILKNAITKFRISNMWTSGITKKDFFSPKFALIALKIDILNVNVITNKPLININVTKD